MTLSKPSDFDERKLDAFLKHELPGAHGPLTVERISGGQSNPTYFLTYPELRLVLRKKPPGNLLPSAHAIDREFRIQKALAETPVPVPTMRLYCADADVIGTAFYVMDRLDGRVFSDCSLPGVDASQRKAMFFGMAETLARLHAVDWQGSGLSDFGRAGDYYQRQIDRWNRQWTLSQLGSNQNVERLQQWLPKHAPETVATTLVHGDFRIGNLMYPHHGTAVCAVFDWELATLGDPLADVAYSALAWRLSSDEYMGMGDRDLDALGIPTEREYLEHYRRCAPQHGPCTPFHFAFALFRLAVIFEGIAARARSGNASAGSGASVGALAARFAELGCRAIDET